MIPARVVVEGTEHLADLAPFDPGVRKALDLVARLAANADDMQGNAPRRRRGGDGARKRTPPGDDSERAFYLHVLGHGCGELRQRAGGAALFGTQNERSDSVLMKSMICFARGLPANMLSTSSSRSFSVPSLENSMR